ncbi:MAG: hypothetical protein ACFFCQ_08690 [Promethearchaeota archaeon]
MSPSQYRESCLVLVLLVLMSILVLCVFLDKTSEETPFRAVGLESYPYELKSHKKGTYLQKKDQSKTIQAPSSKHFLEEAFDDLTGHTGEIHQITFSPSGKILASCSQDQTIRLWNVADGDELSQSPLREHNNTVRCVDFSLDETMLISGSEDRTIRFWDITSGKELLKPIDQEYHVNDIDISPDGTKLALVGDDNTIKLWDVRSKEEIESTPMDHDREVETVAFSPNGTILASGDAGGTIKLWNVNNGKEIHKLTEHDLGIRSMAFSPDGTQLVSGADDWYIRVWDVNNGSELYRRRHKEIVRSVTFSPNGAILASGCGDTDIKLWDTTTWEQLDQSPLEGHTEGVTSLAFSPDGTILASGSKDNKIKLWNMIEGLDVDSVHEHDDLVTSVTFSPDGETLISGSKDGTINLWNINDGANRTLDVQSVLSVAFSNDGKILASSSSEIPGRTEKTIRLWNVTNGNLTECNTQIDYYKSVSSVVFSPSNNTLASGCTDGVIRFWDVQNGDELKNISAHDNQGVSSIVFSPDGTKLASGGYDGRVKLWNATHEKLLNKSQDPISSVVFSPDGTKLAWSSWDATIRVWNVTSGGEMYPPLTEHNLEVYSVVFSPNGAILASGDKNGIIKVWNVNNGEEIQSLKGHDERIGTVCFSHDGTELVSGDENGIIKFWNVTDILNPNLDFDRDGMVDRWEREYGLNSNSWEDKFMDPDQDGLINSLEHFLMTFPNNTDSDRDGMLDGKEYFLGLKPSFDDASLDLDADGMPNIYEYYMSLNPRVDDADDDLDGDGLKNLLEFQIRSWANQTDTDTDGMPDKWEHTYNFNASDSSDAMKDADGDGISNLKEYNNGTDPRNFWSVPLFTLSLVHLIIILFALLILILSGVSLIIYKAKQRQKLVASLKAPDYLTALKIQSAGLTDYSTYLQSEKEGKELCKKANTSYLQGNYLEALQHYEQALKIFEHLTSTLLIAETIFNCAWIQAKSLGSIRDSILQHFPKPPYTDPRVEAFKYMIQALTAETMRNWGAVKEAWQIALNSENLDITYQIICQGALVEVEVRDWLSDPTISGQEEILSHLNKWQKTCETNGYIESLCQVYLLQVRFNLATFQLNEAQEWLERCLKIAEEEKLILYQNIAQKEKEVFTQQKKRFMALSETEKLHSPEEQEKRLQEYIKGALHALETVGLRKKDE